MGAHRRRVIAWLVVIAVGVAGVPFVPLLTSIAWLAAMGYGVATAYFLRKHGGAMPLLHPAPYRALIVAFLAAAALGIATGASVVFTDPASGRTHLEAGGMSAFFVVVLVMAWRAWTVPSPRRAALLGVVAICGSVPAVIIDALTSVGVRYKVPITATTQGFICAADLFVVALLGALACVAGLTTFGAGGSVPEARLES